MVPVYVEGVRRNFGISSVYMYTASLVDEAGERMFPLLVERHEALPIVAALHGLEMPRPQTINIMVETLKLAGMRLEEIRLESLSTSPIYLLSATLRWRMGNQSERVQRLEMRPGDALGLALLMESRMLLADELARRGFPLGDGQTPETLAINDLLRREGITLPAGKSVRLGYSKTPMRDALVKEFKAALLAKAPPFPEDDLAQRKRDYLATLLPDGWESWAYTEAPSSQ